MLDDAVGRRCPDHVHSDVEQRVASLIVGEGNGCTQARRDEPLIDLESSSIGRAGGVQQRYVRAGVKLADKDEGIRGLLVLDGLKAVNFYNGVDTAIGTQAAEVSDGGPAMELVYQGSSRGGMSPWGAGGESECYE